MIRYALIREVKEPTRGTSLSAGMDIYVPKFTDNFIKVFNTRNTNPQSQALFDTAHNNIQIKPHGQVFIPSGLQVNFEDEKPSALIVFDKGGVSFDSRVMLLAKVTDQDYQGEIFITMTNYSDYPTILVEGQKITQLVRVPVFYDKWVKEDKDSLYVHKTERGEGALGSTGK